MVNHNEIQILMEKFHIDFLNDLLLVNERHLTFYIDLGESIPTMHILSGDVTKLGLIKKTKYRFDEFMSFIEPNNLLAEIEGRHTFLEDTKRKVLEFEKELYLYVPIKSSDNPLWLSINLEKLDVVGGKLIFGRVYRIYDHVPDEINYYQKTYQDSLTGLFTRETLKLHLENLKNTDNSYGLYIDIDNFKKINDTYGHDVGDQFLVNLANHFISKWEHNVIYYRLGGDEFFVYVYDHTKDQVESRAKMIIQVIENLDPRMKRLNVSASIGIIKIIDENKKYHDLLNQGDRAMYKSKKSRLEKITIN